MLLALRWECRGRPSTREDRQEGPGRRLSFIQHLMESGDGFLRFSQVGLVVKIPPANAGDVRDTGLIPGFGRSPGEGHGNPGFLPGESHGQRSLAGYSPRGHKELDTNEAT